MYYKMMIIVAVFLILSVASIKSDHIEDDCREIHCPVPEFDCPTDSDLKSSINDDTDSIEEDDEESDSNPFDRLADEGLIEEFFPETLLPSSSATQPPGHVVQKRSLQHRRREVIKIVPGDYRSFEPEFFKYHNHHPHRKWKRDLIMGVQPHSEADIKKCCPDFQCVCRSCPGAPKCDNKKVAIMTEEGHGLPGSCCSKYECVPEMECSASSQPKMSYWRDECTKCDCFAGQELCQQLCETKEDDSANNCFSGYLNRPKMNGDTWLEDEDCKECKCINGDSQCQESICKPVDCANPLKIEGRCCKVCPPTTTSTTTTEAIKIISTTDIPIQTTDSPLTTTVQTTSTPTPSTLSSTEPVTSTSFTTESITNDDEENSTTYTAPTIINSTPNGMEERLKDINIYIVPAIAILLMVIWAIGAAHVAYVYIQTHKEKKSMYSTIPSSESSQSSSVTLA